MKRLDLFRKVLAGDLPKEQLPVQFPPTINQTLGIELVSVDELTCTMRMQTDPARHANPMGTIHGGVFCDLGDAAMGVAHSTALEDGETFTSVDLRINFFRPVWKDVLTARSYVVRHGRTISFHECDITDSKDRLVAKLSSTIMTLRGDQAQGR